MKAPSMEGWNGGYWLSLDDDMAVGSDISGILLIGIGEGRGILFVASVGVDWELK